jgi:hypothetical protein
VRADVVKRVTKRGQDFLHACKTNEEGKCYTIDELSLS